MLRLRRIGTLVLLASLVSIVVCSPAAGQANADLYGNPPGNEQPPTPISNGSPPGGLPFTGFDAGLLLLFGVVAVGTGIAIRRGTNDEPHDWTNAVAVAPVPLAPARGAAEIPPHVLRCDVCGTEFDANSYQLLVPGRSGVFDTVECASAASVQRGPVPAHTAA